MEKILAYYTICKQENPQYHIIHRLSRDLRDMLYDKYDAKLFFANKEEMKVSEDIVGGNEGKQKPHCMIISN